MEQNIRTGNLLISCHYREISQGGETFQEYWGGLERDDSHGEDGILGAYREYTVCMRNQVCTASHLTFITGVKSM